MYTVVGGQIEQNGVLDTRTSDVTLILIDQGLLYQYNSYGNWYSTNGTGWPNSTWSSLGPITNPCAGGTSGGTSGGSTSSGSSSSGGGGSSSSGGGGGSCGTPMAPPPGYTSSQLAFDEQFCGTSLDTSKWNAYMTSDATPTGYWDDEGSLDGCQPAGSIVYSGANMSGTFYLQAWSADAVSVNDGLTLPSILGAPSSCVGALGYSWTGALIDTYNKFAFTGGYFQASMQQPDTSTGEWPAVWFLAAPGSNGPEIDLEEGGVTPSDANLPANTPFNQIGHSNIPIGVSAQGWNTGVDWSQGFHTLGMLYQPGSLLTVYFDGQQVATNTSNIPTGGYYIIINSAIANSSATGWHTVGSNSSPSPANFLVKEVQFYQ